MILKEVAVIAAKSKQSPQSNKKCVCCGDVKDVSKFYKHTNKYLCDDVGVCKSCVEQVGATNDMKEIHRMMRLMDLVFLPDRWEACTSSDNTLTTYIGNGKGINNPKAKVDGILISDMRYEDSPTCQQVEDVDTFLVASDSEKLENITRWGEHYSQAEYLKMNASVENNIKITGRDDYSSIKAFERVARAEVQVDRVYGDSNLKAIDRKNAEDTLTATQRQAGLAYEQISKSNSDSTLGTDIRDVIENYEPFPQPDEQFEDVDMIGKYIDKFMTKPLLRSFGKDNSRIIDEFKAIRDEIKARAAKWAKKKSSDNQ